MNTTWVVAANAGRARLFAQAAANAPLEEIEDGVDTAARLRAADTETDDLGRRSQRHSPTPSSQQPSGYQPHETPKEHEAERFARNVAAVLARGRADGRYAHLVLTAAPEFLGLLRRHLDPQVASCVRAEIHHDYTQLDPARLRERIAEHAP